MATAKAKNQNLHKARNAKQDEFYTQLPDIEKELKHYKKHFKGKVVYCNCDDPEASNFFRYFFLKFKELGLKRLITTCYRGEDGDSFSRGASVHGLLLEYDGNRKRKTVLEGDGDFRSPECVALLEQADVVVTNPPFSLFREYLTQLAGYGKKFLIVGNINAITYKECFELIKTNKMWLGHNCTRHFIIPDGSIFEAARSFWYTNLDTTKRHEKLVLYKKYTPAEYSKYDNYDAIEVGKAVEIPMDYDGAMGVPITFLDKYSPEQFEIIGSFNAGAHGEELGAIKTEVLSAGKVLMWNGPVVSGKPLYKRIVIKRKENQ